MRVTASYLENLIRDWQRAYMAVNGKDAPSVTWENGWFLIKDDRLICKYERVRRSKFEAMRDTLKRRMKDAQK